MGGGMKWEKVQKEPDSYTLSLMQTNDPIEFKKSERSEVESPITLTSGQIDQLCEVSNYISKIVEDFDKMDNRVNLETFLENHSNQQLQFILHYFNQEHWNLKEMVENLVKHPKIFYKIEDLDLHFNLNIDSTLHETTEIFNRLNPQNTEDWKRAYALVSLLLCVTKNEEERQKIASIGGEFWTKSFEYAFTHPNQRITEFFCEIMLRSDYQIKDYSPIKLIKIDTSILNDSENQIDHILEGFGY